MPVINGRLTCCQCGADLGDASDPYRDPACANCLQADLQADLEEDLGGYGLHRSRSHPGPTGALELRDNRREDAMPKSPLYGTPFRQAFMDRVSKAALWDALLQTIALAEGHADETPTEDEVRRHLEPILRLRGDRIP